MGHTHTWLPVVINGCRSKQTNRFFFQFTFTVRTSICTGLTSSHHVIIICASFVRHSSSHLRLYLVQFNRTTTASPNSFATFPRSRSITSLQHQLIANHWFPSHSSTLFIRRQFHKNPGTSVPMVIALLFCFVVLSCYASPKIFVRKSRNFSPCRGLLWKSPHISSVGQYRILRFPFSTWSVRKK